jgi:hypothetical protein
VVGIAGGVQGEQYHTREPAELMEHGNEIIYILFVCLFVVYV